MTVPMQSTPLTAATLAEIGQRIAVPAYDRSRVEPGIVHVGVGAFHRSHQAMYLDRLLNNETLPIYVEALCSQDPAMVEGATTVLSRGRTYDPTPMLQLFADPRVPKARLETILSAQMKSIQPRMLISVLPDLSKDARGIIFRILEKGADSTIVAEAVRLAVHTEWWLRLHMAKLLAKFPSDEGTQAVLRLVRDENQAVRLEAVRCLGRLKAVAGIPALCERLRDPDIKVHTAAIEALIQIGDVSAVPHLVEVLKDESEYARRGAVEVLNEVVTTEAIKDLVSALRDEDWWVRVRAADALGTLGGDRVVEAVISLLGDGDDFVRRYAVEILNTVPDARAVEPLIRALEDPDWWVHERAIDALAKTGDARAVEPLIRLMQRDPKALPLCIRALSALGDPRAVEPLARLTTSESAEVRREAINALTVLSRTDLPQAIRAQAATALEAVGVRPERSEVRMMEARTRRAEFGPEAGRADLEPGARAAAAPQDDRRGSSGQAGASGGGKGESPTTGPVDLSARPLDLQALPSGTRLLDRYKVIRKIGGGGFGAVYLVEDVVVREELVLKVLSPQLSLDENMIRRFVQELKLTRRITHRNVIRIYDFLNLGGAHAISMEFFPGRDLSRMLKDEGPLPLDLVLRLAAQVCEGLAAAHEVGVVHRDIKPPNILVGDDQVVKIVDFGLAAMGQQSGSRLTKSGILVGTPEYISPEQITGTDVDGRADIYSFGVVMYEMLSGRQPFTGSNAVNLLFQHLEGDVEPLGKLVPGIPTAVERLVTQAMSRDPSDRPGSANVMLQMIRAAADCPPAKAHAFGAAAQAPAPASAAVEYPNAGGASGDSTTPDPPANPAAREAAHD